jgi:hypothetical protein
MKWLIGESQRVWRELQGEALRPFVKTNVPSITLEVASLLTATLRESVKGCAYISQSDVHGAIVFAMKVTKHDYPLSKKEEQLILEAAENYLHIRLRKEVHARIRPLEGKGWKII